MTVTVEMSGQLVTFEDNEANTLMQRLVGEVRQRIWIPAVGLFRSSFGRWEWHLINAGTQSTGLSQRQAAPTCPMPQLQDGGNEGMIN